MCCSHRPGHRDACRNAFHRDDGGCAHHVSPGRGAQADRPLRKNSDSIADTDTARFRAAKASRHDVRTHQHLFVGQTVRHGRKVGHRIRHQQVFRLRAIDRIAKSPATHGLPPGVVLTAALRMKAAKRGVRRARGRNCPCDYALALAITGNGRAQFLDDPHRFVAHRQSPFDGIFALEDMYVGTADGRGGYADQRIEWSDVGHPFLVKYDASGFNEDCGFHNFGHYRAPFACSQAWPARCQRKHVNDDNTKMMP